MIQPLNVALAAQPEFHTRLLKLVDRARRSGGNSSITYDWSSGVEACMSVARMQNAANATRRLRSAPSVTRNGSDSSCNDTVVASFPNLRASTGADIAAAAVTSCVIEKNDPIWALEQSKRVAKYRFMNGITSPAPAPTMKKLTAMA